MGDVSKFLSGFRRFQHQYLGRQSELFQRLVKDGQHPRALVIACCDSRCDPALVTDSDPGDMFVVRNVANLVPPYIQAGSFAATSSAIAFAISTLNVEHIIVMGHARCGGIRALIANKSPECEEEALIGKWLGIAADARQRVLNDLPGEPADVQARACEQASVLISLENLLSYPWIAQRIKEGRLTLHGWYFDMDRGALLQFHHDTAEFRVLVPSLKPATSEKNFDFRYMP